MFLFQGYGFPVGQLYDLLLELRDMYSEVLMKKWVSIFDGIFNEDNYTPIYVESDEDYQKITAVYPYEDDGLEKVSDLGTDKAILKNMFVCLPTYPKSCLIHSAPDLSRRHLHNHFLKN
jgi:hypothetical protein